MSTATLPIAAMILEAARLVGREMATRNVATFPGIREPEMRRVAALSGYTYSGITMNTMVDEAATKAFWDARAIASSKV